MFIHSVHFEMTMTWKLFCYTTGKHEIYDEILQCTNVQCYDRQTALPKENVLGSTFETTDPSYIGPPFLQIKQIDSYSREHTSQTIDQGPGFSYIWEQGQRF